MRAILFGAELGAALVVALAAAGCSSPNVRSCTIEMHDEQTTCLEYQRASQPAIDLEARPACGARSGHWADEPCSRNETVGGCMQRVVSQKYGAYTLVTWYYSAATGLRTPHDVGSVCRSQGGVGLSP
jgi:hypothetical protein